MFKSHKVWNANEKVTLFAIQSYKSVGCPWICLSVYLFAISSEIADSNELKFWGMIPFLYNFKLELYTDKARYCHDGLWWSEVPCTVPAPLATSNHRVETTVKFYKVFSYLLTLTEKNVIDIQSSL